MASIVRQLGLQSSRHHVAPAVSTACGHASYSTDVKPLSSTRLTAMKRGTGGRSSFNGIVATVFGNSGFLGRYLCNKLGKIGTQLILPYRCDHYDVLRLRLVGDLGQVLFMPYDIRDDASIKKAMKYSNVVINLIGRDWETKNFKFEDIYIDGPARIARLAKESGIEKFIHVSNISAEEFPEPLLLSGGSKILKTKFIGEQVVRDIFPDAVIFRPSDMYGSEDRFLRSYANVWRRQYRAIPLWRKGEATIKQPVFVSDVAAGIVAAIKNPDVAGKTYCAVGPKRYQLSELVDWFFRVMRRGPDSGYFRYDMRFDPFFKLKVTLTEKVCPGWPIASLSWEKLEKDHVTDVVPYGLPTLEDLGVTLTHMEDQVPWELKPFRANAYYDEELGEFEKPAPPKFIPNTI
ncbi:NADH dehydrogenase [ubiquinone] 1 alpha subcomplex subunit 9, mitochondrial [Neocloeon triangulifer]|uniref:NADH dehydrogenase [ubiquinone] 1 alpha subcomplex subunit 9, mitochondrial n=1 Tax=Neocloeon triangulifer TaxID=2078957 RepID=UPI00286F339D|nr:NADH dehydrogenase [ubiquinone] 1 alpha subcomplex subunit 9, mitochondrial [Neocloeon triangulifer]